MKTRDHKPEYDAWYAMLRRCSNREHPHFADYGGRGISVCPRWSVSFVAFLSDMGLRPSPRHSLDRIDNDGNYEPSNCRWATAIEQRHNRRQYIENGGSSPGIANPNSALTDDAVREIRRRSADGESHASLSRSFSCSDSHIAKIVNRKRWPHIA